MAILDLITEQLSGDHIKKLSDKLGIDKSVVDKAVKTAVPMIVSALAKNAKKPGGAEALDRAIARDHDGSLLDSLGDHLDKSDHKDGDAILGHALGAKREAVEKGLAAETGMPSKEMAKVMSALAPVVMGGLGKKKRADGLDAQKMSQILNAEARARREAKANKKSTSPLDKVMDLIDADDDGDVSDDLGKAASMLGGLFKK